MKVRASAVHSMDLCYNCISAETLAGKIINTPLISLPPTILTRTLHLPMNALSLSPLLPLPHIPSPPILLGKGPPRISLWVVVKYPVDKLTKDRWPPFLILLIRVIRKT